MPYVRDTNDKLKERAVGIVQRVTGCPDNVARNALAMARKALSGSTQDGVAALAIPIALGHDPDKARAALLACDGDLHETLASLGPPPEPSITPPHGPGLLPTMP